MTTDSALAFLREHQPMPEDRDLETDLAQAYIQAFEAICEDFRVEAVPLLLGSLGESTIHGVAESVIGFLDRRSREEVVPFLPKSLQSEQGMEREAAAQLAYTFPDPSLDSALISGLGSEDPDFAQSCAMALAASGSAGARAALKSADRSGWDPVTVDLLEKKLK